MEMNLAKYCRLRPQQRQTLRLIAEGATLKSIAVDLGISVKTAEYHYRQLRKKVHMDTVAQLTKFALYLGITEPYVPEIWRGEGKC